MTKDEVREDVEKTIAPPASSALVTLAWGCLQLRNDPVSDQLGGVLTAVFGVPTVPEQIALQIVDWYDLGRRKLPPFPQRPQIEPLLRQELEGEPTPAPAAIAPMVDVACGIHRDRYPDMHTVVKFEICRLVARAWAAGTP